MNNMMFMVVAFSLGVVMALGFSGGLEQETIPLEVQGTLDLLAGYLGAVQSDLYYLAGMPDPGIKVHIVERDWRNDTIIIPMVAIAQKLGLQTPSNTIDYSQAILDGQ